MDKNAGLVFDSLVEDVICMAKEDEKFLRKLAGIAVDRFFNEVISNGDSKEST